MNTHYTYFLILAASLTGPLALSFDKKVGFYKNWKYLFPAMIIPAGLYIAWDIYFTHKQVWSFNPGYITGLKFINLPLEEVLFFFVVPYCCLFIYECIRCYFPGLSGKKFSDNVLHFLAVVLFVTGIFFLNKYYTGWTFILCSVFIGGIFVFSNFFRDFNATCFLVSFAIVLIPFLVVNGYLTAIPVVVYNDSENLGIRLFTIPFEDIFYGMLLMLMNVAFFEKLRNGQHIAARLK